MFHSIPFLERPLIMKRFVNRMYCVALGVMALLGSAKARAEETGKTRGTPTFTDMSFITIPAPRPNQQQDFKQLAPNPSN